MAEEQHGSPTRTLWLLICDIGHADELYPFYAVSEEEAEQKAQAWIARQGSRVLRRISLKSAPHGFRIFNRELPGTLP